MEAKLQLRVQRYGWDAAATVYEDEWQANLEPAQERMIAALDLGPGQRVVETAAGSGLVTIPMASAVGPEGEVLATDISGEMVQVCESAVAAAGLANVRCDRQNAEALDVVDESFDRAACCLGLMYCPNPDVALSEMKRVLKAGGRMAVAVWGERRNCGWAELFPITDAQVQSEVCPMFFGLGAPGALVREVEGAGFRDVEEHRISTVMRFAGPEPLLRAMIDGGAVALAAKRFTSETRQLVDDQFLASVSAFKTGDGYEIPGEFVIASGTV